MAKFFNLKATTSTTLSQGNLDFTRQIEKIQKDEERHSLVEHSLLPSMHFNSRMDATSPLPLLIPCPVSAYSIGGRSKEALEEGKIIKIVGVPEDEDHENEWENIDDNLININ